MTKKVFEYVLLALAFLAIIMIIIKREGFSNLSTFPSTYNNLLLDSFHKKGDNKNNNNNSNNNNTNNNTDKQNIVRDFKGVNYSEQVKHVPKSEMSSYAQVTNNISPNLIPNPCSGNEPFPGMCSTLYATY